MVIGLRTTALVVICIIATSTNGRSQSTEHPDNLHFSVDRPGISDFPTITPKGHTQMELGFEYYQREDYRTIMMPTLMLRNALNNWLEFRFTGRVLRVDSVIENSASDKHYVFASVEMKGLILKERGWRPGSAALLGYSITPNTSAKLRGPMWGNYALLLFENNIHDKWVFNYNVGLTWNGAAGTSSLMYSLATEYEISDRHEVFIEQATFFNGPDKNDHWVNIGYTHLEARHSQLDFSTGFNFNGGRNDFFFAVGYSTRFGYHEAKAKEPNKP